MPIIIYDVAIAIIILLCVSSGRKKGLFLTACGFFAMFIALFGAVYVTNTFAPVLAESLAPVIETPLRSAVEAEFPDGVTLDGLEGLEALPENFSFDKLPDIAKLWEDSPMLSGFLDDLEFPAVGQGISDFVSDLASNISLQVARIILFIISFLVILVAWGIVSHTLNLTFQLPILSTVNNLGGVIIGLLQGLLVAYILSWVVSWGILSISEIENTMLLKHFLAYNPLPMLTSIFALGSK